MKDDFIFKENDELLFGDIVYRKLKDNSGFDYSIDIDFSKINALLYTHENISNITHATSWNREKDRVLSTLTIKQKDGEKINLAINFEKTLQGSEKMYLYFKDIDISDDIDNIHNLFITNFFDEKESLQIVFDGMFLPKDQSQESIKYSSFVKLDNHQGLQIVHFDMDQNFTSHDIIDTNATLLATMFCHSDDNRCSLDNSQSWYSSTDDIAIFNPLKSYAKLYDAINLSNTNLSDGSYFYIPSNLYHENLSIGEVLSKSVGQFVVINHHGYGIYNSEDRDDVVLLKALFTQEQHRDGYFKIVN